MSAENGKDLFEVPVEYEGQGGQGVEPRASSSHEGEEERDEKYLRLLADFENYRRRMRQREAEVSSEAEARLIARLLPVVDDLERMLEHVGQEEGAVAEGARLIYQKFLEILRSQGLESVDGVNEPFDPEVHHALQTVAVGDPELDGRVLRVTKKGYKYKGRLLRPAEVVVGRYGPRSDE